MPAGPPPLPHQIAVFERVLQRCAEGDGVRPPLVVFDLDGTLYDNRPRTLQILMEYAEEVRDQDPEIAQALLRLENESVQYLLTDTLRGVGIHHTEIVRDITSYWNARFFSDDYISYDQPMPGSQEFARACYDAGASIIYLTGRDIPGMFLGTVASLRDCGFPLGVAAVELMLKPDAGLADEAFKRGALPTLDRVGDVIAFFDNEPANCNLARQIYPDATIALIDTQSVPGAPPPDEGVELISDFRWI